MSLTESFLTMTVGLTRLLALLLTFLSVLMIFVRIQLAAKSRWVKKVAFASWVVIPGFAWAPTPFANPVHHFLGYLIRQPWYWAVVTLVFSALVVEYSRYTRLHPIVVKTPVSSPLSEPTEGFRRFYRPIDD